MKLLALFINLILLQNLSPGQSTKTIDRIDPYYRAQVDYLFPFFTTSLNDAQMDQQGQNSGVAIGINKQFLSFGPINVATSIRFMYMNYAKFTYVNKIWEDQNKIVIQDDMGIIKYTHFKLVVPIEIGWELSKNILLIGSVHLNRELTERSLDENTNTKYYYYDHSYKRYLPYLTPKIQNHNERLSKLTTKSPTFGCSVGARITNPSWSNKLAINFKYAKEFQETTLLILSENVLSLGIDIKLGR